MLLLNSKDLKAKIPTENSAHDSRLENLKSSLRLAYNLVQKANENPICRTNGYMTGKQN